MLAGLVVTADPAVGEEIHFLQQAVGAVLSPNDSWLLLRGIKTLGVRMEKHESNARFLAQWLQTQEAVKRVYYPGLTDHPQHQLAREQARGFGGMLSFELADPTLTEGFLGKLELITHAISLGAVESLICRLEQLTPPCRRKCARHWG